VDPIIQEWHLPKEVAPDLVKLAFFAMMILCDKHVSMAAGKNGERIDDLTLSVPLLCLL